MTTSLVSVGTHNLLHSTATPKPFADVIGWQEDDDKIAASRLPDRYDTYVSTIPGLSISWDTTALALEHDVADQCGDVLTHRGRPKVSPNRGFAWLRLYELETLERFTFIDTHMVSGAWSAPRLTTRWRRRHWRHHREELSRFVALEERAGRRAVLVGDFNRHKWLHFGNLRHAPRADGHWRPSYDQIYASRGLALGEAIRRPLWGSDHHAWSSTLLLRGPR